MRQPVVIAGLALMLYERTAAGSGHCESTPQCGFLQVPGAAAARAECTSAQLVRNHAHLFVDVILAHALSERRELAFGVRGVLSRLRAEFKHVKYQLVI
jgi:hypothetical protein